MTVYYVQNDFSHGEIDPKMKSHIDMKLYQKSAEYLRNVVVMPQGGARRRFGTKFLQSIGELSSGEYALFEFNHDVDDNYLLLLTNFLITIFKDDVQVATVVSPWPSTIFVNNGLKAVNSKNSTVFVNEDYAPRNLVRGNTDADWVLSTLVFKNYPTFDFKQNYNTFTFTLNNVATGSRTLTCDNDIFVSSDYVGGSFIGIGETNDIGEQTEGFARITAITDARTATVTVVKQFDGSFTGGVIGSQVVLGEKSWSDTRGWPISATFHENRLVFGGSKSLPTGLFLSVTNDFLNFDTGTGQDNDSIQYILTADGIGRIHYVVSNRTLQIFANNGEYVAQQLETKPLTEGDVSFRQQSNYGSENVKPQKIDNQTIYVKAGGKGVNSFYYEDDRAAYQSAILSVTSPHLIRNPVASAIQKGSTTDDADYLFFVNEDGTLVIYQTLKEQNVAAWTLSTTEGYFKKIVAVGSDIYFLVQRQVYSKIYVYLEKLDWDLYMDCATTQTFGVPTTHVTGLDYIDEFTVNALSDGFVQPAGRVVYGAFDVEDAGTTITIGIPYTPLIQPNAVNVMSQQGPTMYIKKRIPRIFIDYYESLGIYVNGDVIPYRTFDDATGELVDPITDVYEYLNLQGWNRRESVIITQNDPLPMTILAVGYEVEV
jgi:hypothetical protein